jgi:hypothetical protein
MRLYKFIIIGYVNFVDYPTHYKSNLLFDKGINYLNSSIPEPVEFDYDMSNKNKLVFRCVDRSSEKVIGYNVVVTPDLFEGIHIRVSGEFGKQYKDLKSKLADKFFDVLQKEYQYV